MRCSQGAIALSQYGSFALLCMEQSTIIDQPLTVRMSWSRLWCFQTLRSLIATYKTRMITQNKVENLVQDLRTLFKTCHVTRSCSKKSRLYWQITCWWSGNTSAHTSNQHWLHLARICRLVQYAVKQLFSLLFPVHVIQPFASWTWRNWMFTEKHTVASSSWNQQCFPVDRSCNHCIPFYRRGIVQLVS